MSFLLRTRTLSFHVSVVFSFARPSALVLIISFLTAGELVQDGTDFRNGAHLRFKADIFVPCGGR